MNACKWMWITSMVVMGVLAGCGESSGDDGADSTDDATDVTDVAETTDTADTIDTTDSSDSTDTIDTTEGGGTGLSYAAVDRSECAQDTGVAANHCKVGKSDPGNTSEMGYWEYLPSDDANDGPFPLILFLHGLGEIGSGAVEGSGGLDKINLGIPRLIRRNDWPPAALPDVPGIVSEAIVLSPQWDSGCHPGTVVRDYIAWAVENYPIDESRIYVTGVSCGGIATWNYLGRIYRGSEPTSEIEPAAVVPIAGDGRGAYNAAGCEIGRVPIWSVHGDADTRVATAGTTVPINSLNDDCTGDEAPVEAKMTLYPDQGHSGYVWNGTYDGSRGVDIYSWMFSFTRD